MPSQYQILSPVKGVNVTNPPIVLDDTECQDAQNFLFERGIFFNRPACNQSLFTPPGLVTMGRSFDLSDYFITAIIVNPGSGNTIYKWDDTGFTEVTGDALTLPLAPNIEMANGVVLISGDANGIQRWLPTGNTRTTISDAKYRYVTSHLSRALAANKYGTDATLDPITVAWSVAGDETDWTSFGSGATVLADATGGINAIANVRGTIVIGRTDGFHLGTATGVSTPPYNWQLHSRNAPGVFWPSTFDVWNTLCFFVGQDDVYTFDLSNVNSIGLQIRSELMSYLNQGYNFRGFVSQGYGSVPRPQYHLVPYTVADFEIPHYCYDVLEGNWSKHSYNFSPYGGFDLHLNRTVRGPLLPNADGALVGFWDAPSGCESELSLKFKTTVLGSVINDAQITRGIILYRCEDADIPGAEFLISANLGDLLKETSTTIQELFGEARWRRRWFDFRSTGNLFDCTLRIPAGVQFSAKLVGLEWSEAGQLREG